MKRRTAAEVRRVSDLLRGELDWIVLKALEKDRRRRYQSAREMSDDVQRHLTNEPVLACPPSINYRLGKLVRRHRGLFSVASVMAVTMLFFSGLLWHERQLTFAALEGEKAERKGAEQQQLVAMEHAETARRSEAIAVEQREQALTSQYNAEIVSGQVDWQQGYLQRLNSKLRSHLPLPDSQERRGWEWYYLWSLCHPEVRTLSSGAYAEYSPDGEYIGTSNGDI